MSMHINLKIGRDEYRAVPLEHIAYIEGHKRECTVHRWPPYHTDPIAAAANIGETAKSLRNFGFIQCHRNYIVSPKSLRWFSDEHIRLMHGKSIPVSPKRLRRLRTGRSLPSNIIYTTTTGGLCLIATHGGPLYASKAPLAPAAGHAPTNDTAQPLGGGKSQRYHQHRAPAQARGNNGRWGTAKH